MRVRFGITSKLTLVFVLFAAVLLSGLGTLAYLNGRAGLEAATKSELLSKSIDQQAALNSWADERLARVKALADTPSMTENLEAFVTFGPGTPEARAAHDRLVRDLLPRTGPGQPFLALIVLDPDDGQVIAGTDPNEEGKYRENLPYFINGRNGPYVQNVYYSTALQAPAMTVSAPMRDGNGRLLGVLAGRLNLKEMNEIVNRRAGLRQTDEAFLVNTSKLFVTQPRLSPTSNVLAHGIHTEAVNRCLTHTSGVISAPDYRGVPAIIAYRWLPERQVCLIVKMDQAEAFAPADAFGRTIALFGGLVLAVATFLAFGIARGITQPVLAMQAGAARFGQGELDVRLPESARDELGQLAHEFNDMAKLLAEKEAQLRTYAEGLERRVEERTAQLEQANRYLVESEQRYHGIFDDAPVSIWLEDWKGVIAAVRDLRSQGVTDFQEYCADHPGFVTESLRNVKVLDVNHETLTMFKAEAKEDMLASLEVVFSTDDTLPGFIGELVALGEGKRVYKTEMALRTVQGELIHVILTMSFPPDGSTSNEVLVSLMDITERKRAEEAIQRMTEDLRRSNSDLEQFAYVASHDLQEPLRMVSSYVQLLAQRYQGRLDGDADEFIAFAVDGATRMKSLINDLLAYSRVGSRGKPFKQVPCDEALDQALENLQVAIEESRAVVEREPLPVVEADDTQLIQLFQNLIGNAIKFRSSEEPRIRISAGAREGEWLFSVQDNGIGMEPQYLERIFIIFQRLHGRDQYSGTGMGLAICRKIVERHGGRTWAESEPGQGSTFFFTFPISGGK